MIFGIMLAPIFYFRAHNSPVTTTSSGVVISTIELMYPTPKRKN